VAHWAAKPDTVIVDLSADYRFDNSWLRPAGADPGNRYNGQKHISNPGCYATAMQLAVHPLLDLLAGPPQCFGVPATPVPVPRRRTRTTSNCWPTT
jgi:N-acetyl-gamma-glutamyl-phosphate reductase